MKLWIILVNTSKAIKSVMNFLCHGKKHIKTKNLMNSLYTQNLFSQESTAQGVSSLKYTCHICNKDYMKYEDLMFHLQNNPSCFLMQLCCDEKKKTRQTNLC